MFLSLSMSLYFLCLCIFVGHVMPPHHSDQMSQRSQVSRVALWRCSLNVFVFVIVFVFVFVIVFLLVRSCLIITLIKCLKGHSLLLAVRRTYIAGRYRAVSATGWTAKKRMFNWQNLFPRMKSSRWYGNLGKIDEKGSPLTLQDPVGHPSHFPAP